MSSILTQSNRWPFCFAVSTSLNCCCSAVAFLQLCCMFFCYCFKRILPNLLHYDSCSDLLCCCCFCCNLSYVCKTAVAFTAALLLCCMFVLLLLLLHNSLHNDSCSDLLCCCCYCVTFKLLFLCCSFAANSKLHFGVICVLIF